MKKLDSQGFSLVELILAMAMMAIVSLGALTILNSASVSYQYSNNELNLQTEAQILINQIEDRALTADNVSYDKIAGTDDYLLTLYHIQYLNKSYSAITQEEIFWIHKGTDKRKNTIFLFNESLTSGTMAEVETAVANLSTTSAIKTVSFIKPAADNANAEMESIRQDVIDEINDALTDDTKMEDIYKKHMLCRYVESFTCNAPTKTAGGFDTETKLSVEIELKNQTKSYKVSDVAHLRGKLRKVPV